MNDPSLTHCVHACVLAHADDNSGYNKFLKGLYVRDELQSVAIKATLTPVTALKRQLGRLEGKMQQMEVEKAKEQRQLRGALQNLTNSAQKRSRQHEGAKAAWEVERRKLLQLNNTMAQVTNPLAHCAPSNLQVEQANA